MKKTVILLLIFSYSINGLSQVQSTLYENKDAFQYHAKIKTSLSKAIPVKKMQAFDVDRLLKDDKQDEDMKDVPFRFGYGFDVDYTLNDGVWETQGDNNIWSLKISSEGAYSLNFIFEELFLSENAELYIFSADGSMVYGPVTKEQNISGQNFLSDIVAGDEVVVQLIEPVSSIEKSFFRISKVVHAYVNILPSDALNTSLSCNNDVQCHSIWNTESNGIALVLLSSGDILCSGSLLNNTNQDKKPYFLSAFHCIDINADGIISATEKDNAQNWAFRFFYKKTTCNGNTLTTHITYNNANFRAAWVNTDFLLMELTGTSFNGLTFLGWDRSGNNPTSGTCIHHPKGDVMKISFDNNTITSNTSSITWNGSSVVSPANTHWVVGLDNGTAESGSSGSPLLNQNRLVVGQLHGGSNGCPPVTKYYGQFHKSWTGGGTNDTRLSNWLNPTGSSSQTLNTIATTTITGPSTVCSGNATFTVSNAPSGYTWGYSSPLTLVSQSGNTATFSKTTAGGEEVYVSIVVGGVTVATHYFFIGGVPDISNLSVNIGCQGSYRYGRVPVSSISLAFEIDQFEWRGTTSSVTIEPHPAGYIDVPGDRVLIMGINGGVEIREHNTCGWSNWLWVASIATPCP
jgi:hypothetical protein